MSDSQDILSEYAFAEQEPKYFEAMPGILDYLTYIEKIEDDDGNVTFFRRRLKSIHKDVYRVMKKLAGEQVCMKTTDYIANMCGCSKNTVTKSKEVLSQCFEQLDGNSLINITEKYTMTKREDKKINKKPVHITAIQPIWKYNNPFMKIMYNLKHDDPKREPCPMKQEISKKEAEIVIEKMSQPGVQEIVHNHGADPKKGTSPKADPKKGTSPLGENGGSSQKWDGHKHPFKQTPLFKEQDPTAKAIQLSLINQKDVEECFASQAKCCEFLEILGFETRVVTRLLSEYNLYEMLSSVLYLRKILENGKEIPSLTGYLLRTLENKWWIPKAS